MKIAAGNSRLDKKRIESLYKCEWYLLRLIKELEGADNDNSSS